MLSRTLGLSLGIVGIVAPAIQAATVVLTFEGLRDGEEVLNYYNGGTGSLGSGPGTNYGVAFSANSLAVVQSNMGGTGNTGGEPTPPTSLFFLSGSADTMNVAGGFTTGFSFFYSAVNEGGTVNVYSGLNATGTLLATLTLPLTPNDGGGCTGLGAASNPGANFCPFLPFGVTFSGTAESVDFGGTANQIAFDNITLGASTPGGGVPEPTSLFLLGSGCATLALLRWRKRA